MIRLTVLTLLLACGSPPADVQEEPEPPIASGQLGLVRQVSWPGGGTELTVKLSNTEGGALQEDLAGSFSLSLDGGGVFDVSVEPESLPVGFTGILIRPASTSAERQAQIAALRTFVEERPESETIGLFLLLKDVRQLAGFTADRERLGHQLERLAEVEPVGTAMAPSEAVLATEQLVYAVGGRAPRGMRAVVLEGVELPAALPSRAAIVTGLDQASARIDEFASSSYYRVAVCPGQIGASGQLQVEGLEGTLPLVLAPAAPESAVSTCDVNAMGSGQRSYPDTIELHFNEAQRSIYDDRVAVLSTADFDLTVTLDGSAPIAASAHLRGKGTLGCERKSYTLTLKGPGRHLLPESRTDEFYLLSMCADDRYVQQYTANLLMQELGLFPLQFRYVEVSLDGETEGVYLLLEKAREEMVRDGGRVHSVMRRRFDASAPLDYFESKFSTGEFDGAAIYASAATDLAVLSETIDLEQYLRFLALMTAYQNGDYIDEIWVTGSEQYSDAGGTDLWFQTMAWDNDDLFSECHYAGRHAVVDPFELIYCAEAAIDHLLLGDADVYSRYVDILEDVLLEQVTPERFDVAAETTEAAIVPIVARPGVSAAMVRLVADNPGAVDPIVAQDDIVAKIQGLREQYRDRHELLLLRIATYRKGQQ